MKFTKENAASYIPLMQALADGKTLQLSHTSPRGYTTWEDLDGGSCFNYTADNYRIKPKPRVVWLHEDGELVRTPNLHKPTQQLEEELRSAGWTKYAEVIE